MATQLSNPTIPLQRIIRGRVEVLRRGEWVDLSHNLAKAEINRGDHTGVGVNPSGTDGVAKTATITLKNADGVNLAPRDRTSPINIVEVDNEPVYDPLLFPNREIRVWGRAVGNPGATETELAAIGDGETDTYILSHIPDPKSVQIQTGFGPRWSDLDDMTWEEATQLTWTSITQPTTPPNFEIDTMTGKMVLSRPLDEGELLVVSYLEYEYDTGWVLEFHGLLGNRIATDGHTVTLEVTDLSKRLQKAYIFGEPDEPYEGPMEDVMQAILNDHPSTQGVVLYFPGGTLDNPRPESESPAWFVTDYAPSEMSVFDALGRLASRRGWYVGYRWHEPTQQMQLQLMAPPRWRDENDADYRLSHMTDFYHHDLEDSDNSIVNFIEIVWRAKNGAEHTTTRLNQDSIDRYGFLAGRIREDEDGEINDEESAGRLADAVIADLSDMRGASSLELPIIPGLDVFTSFALDHPQVSSSEDFLGAENVLQIYDFEGGRFRSQISGPNRVVGGYLKWIEMIVRPGIKEVPPRQRTKGHVVVAAHDSSIYWKRIADYICDGVGDHEEINAALDAGSGRVELSDGTFHPSASILINERQTLTGQGRSTILRIPQEPRGFLWGALFTDGPDATLENFVVDGNYRNGAGDPQFVGLVVQHDGALVSNCAFINISYAAIQVPQASRFSIQRCAFVDVRGVNIYVSGQSSPQIYEDYEIVECSFFGNFDNAIRFNPYLANIRVINNVIARDENIPFDSSIGIWTQWANNIKLSGNTIRNVENAIMVTGISQGDEGVVVSDNTIRNVRDGIWVTRVLGGKTSIIGNVVTDSQHWAISLADTDDAVIESNTLEGRGTSLIYVYRSVDGYGNNNTIRNNNCRKTPGESLDYGIWIQGGEGNFVSNNDVLNSGDIEPINDDGVGTIAEGNRV